MEALIHSNERLDDLCRKGYRLIQDPKLFCFGIDAVLLSDYAKVKRGERAVDLCKLVSWSAWSKSKLWKAWYLYNDRNTGNRDLLKNKSKQ